MADARVHAEAKSAVRGGGIRAPYQAGTENLPRHSSDRGVWPARRCSMTLDRPMVSSKPQVSDATTPNVAKLRAAALIVGTVPFVVHAVLALNGFFWQDDFVITYHAASASPTDLGYLFHAHNGEHVAPGCFALAWLVTAIAPLNFGVATLPLLLIQAGASVLFWR